MAQGPWVASWWGIDAEKEVLPQMGEWPGPEQVARVRVNSSPLHPMPKWKNVMAQECMNEEHAGGKLLPQDVMA